MLLTVSVSRHDSGWLLGEVYDHPQPLARPESRPEMTFPAKARIIERYLRGSGRQHDLWQETHHVGMLRDDVRPRPRGEHHRLGAFGLRSTCHKGLGTLGAELTPSLQVARPLRSRVRSGEPCR